MTASPFETERQVVSKVAEDYRRRGYDVTIEPGGSALPEFLVGFRPDLIARRDDESVVVEVKIGVRTSVIDKYQKLAERVNAQPGWRLDLVYIDARTRVPEIPGALAGISEINDRAARAKDLLASGQGDAAFLLLWSSFEGLLRLRANVLRLPVETLPPSTLLRELYSAGELARDAYDLAMELLAVRNSMIHGLAGHVDAAKVDQFAGVVSTLVEDFRHEAG